MKNDIYTDITENVKTNYELQRPLLRKKSEKVIGLMKDELGGKIMTLRPKTNN